MRALLAAAVLLAAPALPARAQLAAGPFPQFSGETNMGLLTQAQPRGGDPRTRGSATFLFGEVAGGL